MRGQFTRRRPRRSGASGGSWRASTATRSAPAHGDRARRAARLPALPARLAARDAGDAHAGPGRAAAVLDQLEGFEVAGRRLGEECCRARVDGYEPAWLDEHCLAGAIVWARIARRAGNRRSAERAVAPGARHADRTAGAPHAALWAALGAERRDPRPARRRRRRRRRADAEHGASFFDELVDAHAAAAGAGGGGTGGTGGAGARQFGQLRGLRALLLPADRRRGAQRAGGGQRCSAWPIPAAGRWRAPRQRASTPPRR